MIPEKFKYEPLVPISELIVHINMITLTETEGRVLLKLFKDFSQAYNSNSLSKEIGITPRGTLKILKKLKSNQMLKSKQLGKATFYKPNLDDEYVSKIIEILLIAEARDKAERWIEEFKEIYNSSEIVLLFGSITKNPKEASDIDVIFVFKKRNYKNIADFVEKKNKILFRKIHEIPQTITDLKENLRNGNKAMIDAIKTGYVLHGSEKVVEVMRDVTGF